MSTYILRRLLLMVPTVIGITFLVFMVIALSPGGIGAGLQQQGGASEASARAAQEAYLEERYGLRDPVLVQYFRWLGRISPVKFGERDLVETGGQLVTRPRAIAPPVLAGEWFWRGEPSLEPTPAAPIDVSMNEQQRLDLYRAAARAYAAARNSYVEKRMALESALRDYADEAGFRRAYDPDGAVHAEVFRRATPDESLPTFALVSQRASEARPALQTALDAREQYLAAIEASPLRRAGFWVIPGSVSLAAPDLGTSFSRSRPVSGMIAQALPVTLMLNLLAFPIIYMVAIPGGAMAATHRGRWVDTSLGALFVALWSVPTVWAGVLALGFLASDKFLGLFPVGGLHHRDADTFAYLPTLSESGVFHRGYLLDTLWHIALPVGCLVYTGFAVLSKQTRAAMLDNFSADYVRTAKAKGVSGRDIVVRHVFRNSLLPLITMFASLFPAMLSGSVVIERIFSVPGMGTLVIDAITLRDRELLMANVVMIGIVNLLALLLADILYALADPRITYE